MKYRDLPIQNLGFFPTPIMKLDRLSAYLDGPRILMKRDDHTGLAFGGNKTRKLEFLAAEALEQGCDLLITGGAGAIKPLPPDGGRCRCLRPFMPPGPGR